MPNSAFTLKKNLIRLAVLSLVGLLVLYALRQDSVYQFAKTRFLVGDQLNASLELLFLSDLHLRNTEASLDRFAIITSQIASLNPDLILLGGDYTGEDEVETAKFRNELLAHLGALTKIAPTYAVLGNHDWWTANDWREALESVDIDVIEGRVEQFSFEQGEICLRGLGDAFTGHYRSIDLPDHCSGLHITLTHDPLAIERDPYPGLYLAGHTHCGQFDFPLIGPLWSSTEASEPYRCGLGRDETKAWLVSAGVGSSIINARFGTTPTIEQIQLVPGS